MSQAHPRRNNQRPGLIATNLTAGPPSGPKRAMRLSARFSPLEVPEGVYPAAGVARSLCVRRRRRVGSVSADLHQLGVDDWGGVTANEGWRGPLVQLVKEHLSRAYSLEPARINTVGEVSTGSEAMALIDNHDLVVNAAADFCVTALLRAAAQAVGANVLSVALQNHGRSLRIDVIPPQDGAQPLPDSRTAATAPPHGVMSNLVAGARLADPAPRGHRSRRRGSTTCHRVAAETATASVGRSSPPDLESG